MKHLNAVYQMTKLVPWVLRYISVFLSLIIFLTNFSSVFPRITEILTNLLACLFWQNSNLLFFWNFFGNYSFTKNI